jgi:hypothetical protein
MAGLTDEHPSADGFTSIAHRAELLRYLRSGARACCDHCNNLDGDPAGHDYGDESAHDGSCTQCEAEEAEW